MRPTSSDILRVIAGAAILVALNLAGEWLAHIAHASVPGSVVGMLLLVVLLHTRILPAQAVNTAANFLIGHLALLLVPAGAAILLYAASLRDSVLVICAAALLSFISVLLVVGLVADRAVNKP